MTTLFNVKRSGGVRGPGKKKARLPRFAEFALFNPWVHKASLLSTGYGEVLKITRSSFGQCIDHFPHIKAELVAMMEKRHAAISHHMTVGDHVPLSLSEQVDKEL